MWVDPEKIRENIDELCYEIERKEMECQRLKEMLRVMEEEKEEDKTRAETEKRRSGEMLEMVEGELERSLKLNAGIAKYATRAALHREKLVERAYLKLFWTKLFYYKREPNPQYRESSSLPSSSSPRVPLGVGVSAFAPPLKGPLRHYPPTPFSSAVSPCPSYYGVEPRSGSASSGNSASTTSSMLSIVRWVGS
eukprot:TRINITY_DN31546_c0_g1_i1.p1 TRINITY_DN31546_c0_g1~~TRINITY_DN31546_c0_g1_i1.p1  ORF type:complete len:194 (+),score=23.55 TRINITY_DN31546_c0_g1_i1:26-607(+)